MIDGKDIENMLASLNKTFAPLHKLIERTNHGNCTMNKRRWHEVFAWVSLGVMFLTLTVLCVVHAARWGW